MPCRSTVCSRITWYPRRRKNGFAVTEACVENVFSAEVSSGASQMAVAFILGGVARRKNGAFL